MEMPTRGLLALLRLEGTKLIPMRCDDGQRVGMEFPIACANTAGTMERQRCAGAVGSETAGFGNEELPSGVVPGMEFVLEKQPVLAATHVA